MLLEVISKELIENGAIDNDLFVSIEDSISTNAGKGKSLSQAIGIDDTENNAIEMESAPYDEKSHIIKVFKRENVNRHLQTLQKEEWLNDTVINFVLRCLPFSKHKKKETIVLDSLLVAQLKCCGVEEENQDKIIRIIKTKIASVDLKKMSHLDILLPMNTGHNHWILVEIKVFTNVITIFDSFHSALKSNEKKNVLAILNGARAIFQQNGVNNDSFNNLKNSKFIMKVNKEIPMQRNSWDCGIYCVLYAKFIYFGEEKRIVFGTVFVSLIRYFLYCHYKNNSDDLITFEEDVWINQYNPTDLKNEKDINYGKFDAIISFKI